MLRIPGSERGCAVHNTAIADCSVAATNMSTFDDDDMDFGGDDDGVSLEFLKALAAAVCVENQTPRISTSSQKFKNEHKPINALYPSNIHIARMVYPLYQQHARASTRTHWNGLWDPMHQHPILFRLSSLQCVAALDLTPPSSQVACLSLHSQQDDFLTGKLAALGIDEDLELSGGEEEDDNPAPATDPATDSSNKPPGVVAPSPQQASASTAAAAVPAASRSTAPAPADDWGAPPSEGCSSGDVGIWGEVDSWGETRKAAPTAKAPPAAGGGRGTAVLEDGELVQMIDQPLRASRGKARGRNVTIKECAEWVCERLGEPKYYLMCQVVSTIGYNKTRDLLEAVQETQVRWRCWWW